MTWRELLEFLKKLEEANDERLDLQVMAYDNGEFNPLDTLELEESDGILDKGHLFLATFQQDWET